MDICSWCRYAIPHVGVFCAPWSFNGQVYGHCGQVLCESCSNDHDICRRCAKELLVAYEELETRHAQLQDALDQLERFNMTLDDATVGRLEDPELTSLARNRQEQEVETRSECEAVAKELARIDRHIRPLLDAE
jgi:hypothetical protein